MLGQTGGNATMFGAAVLMVRGYRLDEESASAVLLEHWNPRCEPKWDLDADPEHADHWWRCIRAAAATSDKPWGFAVETELANERLAASFEETSDDRDPAVDAIIGTLATRGVYQRAGALVHVTREAVEIDGHKVIPAATPTIRLLQPARLREIIRMTHGHKLISLASDVAARGEWAGIRRLDAIVSYPIMRRDGSLLLTSGYDSATSTLAEIDVCVNVPERPTQADARNALGAIVEIVDEFDFVSEEAFAAWLAMLLTVPARPAIDGPTPLGLFEASNRGSGKSLLADVLSVIVTGRNAPRRVAPKTKEEWDKTMMSLLLAGAPLVLIDNVTSMLVSDALDTVLTGTSYEGRILGVSEERSVAVRTVFLATSNNARLSTDLVRRSIACRLEPQVERPEARTDWRYPDLLGHVRQRRAELLSAVLTILRAYAVADRPRVEARPMGSYEAWCRVVRDAQVWAGAPDPAETQDALRETADVERDELRSLLTAWRDVLEDRVVTVRELFDAALGTELQDALTGIMPGGADPTKHAIGNRLRSLRGQIVHGLVLQDGPRARGDRATYRVVRR